MFLLFLLYLFLVCLTTTGLLYLEREIDLHFQKKLKEEHSNNKRQIEVAFANELIPRSWYHTVKRTPSNVRIVQWNMLAPSNARNDPQGFPYAEADDLEWTSRLSLMKKFFDETDPDIICLQECPEDYGGLKKILPQYHFDFYYDYTKFFGLLLVFKKQRFELKSTDASYFNNTSQLYSVVNLFDSFTGKTLTVVNTHLKSKPEFQSVRMHQVKQLRTEIFKHRREGSHIVICADLNDTPDSNVVEHLTKKPFNKNFKPFENCYPLDKLSFTTVKRREDLVVKIEDYLLTLNMTTENFLKMPEWRDISLAGLPSKTWPSDHLALVADLSYS